jgi:hypothetical protein
VSLPSQSDIRSLHSAPRASSDGGIVKNVHCKRNWQRFPFSTGDVAVTGSPSAISPELSGSIVPCLRPSLLTCADRPHRSSTAIRTKGKFMDVRVEPKEMAQPPNGRASGEMGERQSSRGDLTSEPRRMWLWPVAILVSLPIAGYIADLVVNGVDSVGTALAGGLIVGAVIGAAEWFVLRRRVSWLWIPATIAGMAVGLVAGAALVDYGIGRGDLALMGAVTGLAVGTMQALVLARDRIPGAVWWAVANPPAWALSWVVTSYVISRNIDERFAIFGASGALVYGLLTMLLLTRLFRATPEVREPAAKTSA